MLIPGFHGQMEFARFASKADGLIRGGIKSSY